MCHWCCGDGKGTCSNEHGEGKEPAVVTKLPDHPFVGLRVSLREDATGCSWLRTRIFSSLFTDFGLSLLLPAALTYFSTLAWSNLHSGWH